MKQSTIRRIGRFMKENNLQFAEVTLKKDDGSIENRGVTLLQGDYPAPDWADTTVRKLASLPMRRKTKLYAVEDPSRQKNGSFFVREERIDRYADCPKRVVAVRDEKIKFLTKDDSTHLAKLLGQNNSIELAYSAWYSEA